MSREYALQFGYVDKGIRRTYFTLDCMEFLPKLIREKKLTVEIGESYSSCINCCELGEGNTPDISLSTKELDMLAWESDGHHDLVFIFHEDNEKFINDILFFAEYWFKGDQVFSGGYSIETVEILDESYYD